MFLNSDIFSKLKELINKIQNNQKIKSGPQSNRKGSEPGKRAL